MSLTPYELGLQDGQKAAKSHTRKGHPKPSRSVAAKSGDQAEYLRGWAEAHRQHEGKQQQWINNEEFAMPEGVTITLYPEPTRDFCADTWLIFASKDIRKEMPYLAHADGYIWFVARKDGVAIGIAALEFDAKKHTGILHGLYVVPEYRRSGVADQLLRDRIAYLTEQGVLSVKATVSPKSLPILQRHRFQVTRPGKEFSVVERSLLTEVAAAEAAAAGAK